VDDDDRWTGTDYLVWVVIVSALAGVLWSAYMLAMEIGRVVL
jgi:hypothetical protein